MPIEVPLTLYTIAEALSRLHDLTGWKYSDEGLRRRMSNARLRVYRVGNLDLIAEDDLLRLAQLPKPKRGKRHNC